MFTYRIIIIFIVYPRMFSQNIAPKRSRRRVSYKMNCALYYKYSRISCTSSEGNSRLQLLILDYNETCMTSMSSTVRCLVEFFDDSPLSLRLHDIVLCAIMPLSILVLPVLRFQLNVLDLVGLFNILGYFLIVNHSLDFRHMTEALLQCITVSFFSLLPARHSS